MIHTMIHTQTLTKPHKRITVSLPHYTYKLLKKHAKKRGISRFVASAVKDKALKEETKPDPVEEFLKLRGSLPKMNWQEIKAAINQGRR